jgi:hypothetical protein
MYSITCRHIYIHIHIYIYLYLHVCIHTHTHTHLNGAVGEASGASVRVQHRRALCVGLGRHRRQEHLSPQGPQFACFTGKKKTKSDSEGAARPLPAEATLWMRTEAPYTTSRWCTAGPSGCLLTYADVCWPMLTYAYECSRDLCWRMLAYADVCWRMLTNANECWRMLGGALRGQVAAASVLYAWVRHMHLEHVSARQVPFIEPS